MVEACRVDFWRICRDVVLEGVDVCRKRDVRLRSPTRPDMVTEIDVYTLR